MLRDEECRTISISTYLTFGKCQQMRTSFSLRIIFFQSKKIHFDSVFCCSVFLLFALRHSCFFFLFQMRVVAVCSFVVYFTAETVATKLNEDARIPRLCHSVMRKRHDIKFFRNKPIAKRIIKQLLEQNVSMALWHFDSANIQLLFFSLQM